MNDLAGPQFQPRSDMRDDDGHLDIDVDLEFDTSMLNRPDDDRSDEDTPVSDLVIGYNTIKEYKQQVKDMDMTQTQMNKGRRLFDLYEKAKNDESKADEKDLNGIKICKNLNRPYQLSPPIDHFAVTESIERDPPSLEIEDRKKFSCLLQLHKETSETISKTLAMIREDAFGEIKDLEEKKSPESKVRIDELIEKRRKWDQMYDDFISQTKTRIEDGNRIVEKMSHLDLKQKLLDMGMKNEQWIVRNRPFLYTRRPVEESIEPDEDDSPDKVCYSIGRYVNSSIQSMSKRHRARVFKSFIEVDLRLAGPTALADIATRLRPDLNVDPYNLRFYIENQHLTRNKIVEENLEWIERHPGKEHSRKTTPEAVKKELRNYMYNRSKLEYNKSDTFAKVVGCARDIVDALDKKGYFNGIRNYIVQTSPESRDSRLAINSFAALITQTFEANVVHQVLKPALVEMGHEVHLQMFDGLYIDRKDMSDQDLQALETTLNRRIKDSSVRMFMEETKEHFNFSLENTLVEVKVKKQIVEEQPSWQERSLFNQDVPSDKITVKDELHLVDFEKEIPSVPYNDVYNQRYNFICAPMKSGKTEYTKRYIDHVVQRHPETKILVVSNRVSQAETAFSRFKIKVNPFETKDFFLYNQSCSIKTCYSRGCCKHNQDLMRDQKYIICQYESLFHLAGHRFDLVILDEHLSICSQSVSETNGVNSHGNLWHLTNFIQMAKSNLFLDDDLLSTRVSLQFHRICIDRYFKDTKFYVWIQRAMTRNFVVRSMNNTFKKLTSDVARAAKDPTYRIGLVFASKRELLISKEFILKLGVNEKSILDVHADLPEKEKRAILKLIAATDDESIQKVKSHQFVMFTSVIVTGLEFNFPVESVYCFLSNQYQAIVSFVLTQQIGRFRDVKSNQVYVTTRNINACKFKCTSLFRIEERQGQAIASRTIHNRVIQTANQRIQTGVRDHLPAFLNQDAMSVVDAHLLEHLTENKLATGISQSRFIRSSSSGYDNLSRINNEIDHLKSYNRLNYFLIMCLQKQCTISWDTMDRDDMGNITNRSDIETELKKNKDEFEKTVLFDKVYTPSHFATATFSDQLFIRQWDTYQLKKSEELKEFGELQEPEEPKGPEAKEVIDGDDRIEKPRFLKECDGTCPSQIHIHGLLNVPDLFKHRSDILRKKKEKEQLCREETYESSVLFALSKFDFTLTHDRGLMDTKHTLIDALKRNKKYIDNLNKYDDFRKPLLISYQWYSLYKQNQVQTSEISDLIFLQLPTNREGVLVKNIALTDNLTSALYMFFKKIKKYQKVLEQGFVVDKGLHKEYIENSATLNDNTDANLKDVKKRQKAIDKFKSKLGKKRQELDSKEGEIKELEKRIETMDPKSDQIKIEKRNLKNLRNKIRSRRKTVKALSEELDNLQSTGSENSESDEMRDLRQRTADLQRTGWLHTTESYSHGTDSDLYPTEKQIYECAIISDMNHEGGEDQKDPIFQEYMRKFDKLLGDTRDSRRQLKKRSSVLEQVMAKNGLTFHRLKWTKKGTARLVCFKAEFFKFFAYLDRSKTVHSDVDNGSEMVHHSRTILDNDNIPEANSESNQLRMTLEQERQQIQSEAKESIDKTKVEMEAKMAKMKAEMAKMTAEMAKMKAEKKAENNEGPKRSRRKVEENTIGQKRKAEVIDSEPPMKKAKNQSKLDLAKSKWKAALEGHIEHKKHQSIKERYYPLKECVIERLDRLFSVDSPSHRNVADLEAFVSTNRHTQSNRLVVNIGKYWLELSSSGKLIKQSQVQLVCEIEELINGHLKSVGVELTPKLY